LSPYFHFVGQSAKFRVVKVALASSGGLQNEALIFVPNSETHCQLNKTIPSHGLCHPCHPPVVFQCFVCDRDSMAAGFPRSFSNFSRRSRYGLDTATLAARCWSWPTARTATGPTQPAAPPPYAAAAALPHPTS
jgi:hypothetical protein